MNKDILQLLRENKIKLTNERKEIINVLKTTQAPLSPTDLYLRVKALLPKANLTTIYRNLEMLEGLGVVKRLGFNQSSFFYELVSERDHHHHAICNNCGKVEEIENISEKFVNEVAAQTKFKIEDHNLEFFGLCKECQSNES